ncbi:hypothetical protein [Acinetobacter johnsonii]|uniref:hypothetical protein n=1 Tax=Acinetobacter johnsonii TaxID=40214 RepID=UPI0010294D27|nr:hypothetical protein [Acinetobacter johnsonii]RZN87694.1 hypothetical protein EXE24_13580 [Acinetobacter johnsonii]
MNLIEQLGGYDFVKKMWIDGGSLRGTQLEFELLEYRRQHNIFEIDDLITHPSYDWKILKVHDPIKSENLLFAKTNDHVKHHWGHGLVFDDKYVVAISYSECRHATDEEIAAGKRLEVKSEN